MNECARRDCHEFATHTAVFRNGLSVISEYFLCDEHAQQAAEWSKELKTNRARAVYLRKNLDSVFGESARVIVITKGMPI